MSERRTLGRSISIHAPTKERLYRIYKLKLIVHFNPRSHKGSDFDTRTTLSRSEDFNPRSHKGSDDHCIHIFNCFTRFQSTLPQRERRNADARLTGKGKISIHAPTKGATAVCLYMLDSGQIFQSTLPRRERPYQSRMNMTVLHHFNPRSHEGSDASQSRRRMEIDLFQSTLPRRERPSK